MQQMIDTLHQASGGTSPFPYTEKGVCTFAYKNNLPVGLVYIQPLDPSSADILHICVLPEWRRQGLARELIQSLQKTYSTLHLEVETTNNRAVALYTSLGFKTQRERPHYYGANHHAFDMLWSEAFTFNKKDQ